MELSSCMITGNFFFKYFKTIDEANIYNWCAKDEGDMHILV